MGRYRDRVYARCEALLRPYAPWERALDFGSGDGWFAREFLRAGIAREIVPLDVMRRKECFVEPLLYSGGDLPFAAQEFDLTYAIDVLHHCADPATTLRNLLRCTGRYVLIKDHVCEGPFGRLLLTVLDEAFNRCHGVALPHEYQQGWAWSAVLSEEGFVPERLLHPADCHPPPVSFALNRLQFVALWKRRREPHRHRTA